MLLWAQYFFQCGLGKLWLIFGFILILVLSVLIEDITYISSNIMFSVFNTLNKFIRLFHIKLRKFWIFVYVHGKFKWIGLHPFHGKITWKEEATNSTVLKYNSKPLSMTHRSTHFIPLYSGQRCQISHSVVFCY